MSTDAKQAPERPQADVVALKGPKPLPTPSQPPRPDERPSPSDDAAAQLAPNNGDEAKAPLPDGEHDARKNQQRTTPATPESRATRASCGAIAICS